MKRHLFFALFLFLFLGKTFAQPQPCGSDAAMTTTCLEACVICDIDGFTGINNSTIQGQAPPGFCTTTLHHAQWIAFIAGSTSLTIELQVFGCQMGWGLEVGIYESLDCENFNLVSNCEGDIYNNTIGVFTTTQPLTIGQYYYWMMDGNGGDICSYTIHVTQGTTLVPPLPPAGNISGDTSPCLGNISAYSIPPITGANFYQWKIDGQNNTTTNSNFEIDWTTPGSHTVCVTAFNVCDTVAPVCMNVIVYPPAVTNISRDICEGDCVEVGDSIFCDPGNYEVLLKTWQGCDSTVSLTLQVLPAATSSFNVSICEDDSIEVGGVMFYPPGNYQVTASTWQGCDSSINLTLNAIICEMKGAIGATSVFCHGEATGSIVFSITDGTPPFTYVWQQLDGTPSGSGALSDVNTGETIPNLPPGTYLITINDSFGNDVVLHVYVHEPPPLAIGWAASEFIGTNISCPGESDGWLEAVPSGGTPGYTFQWSNGSQVSLLQNIPAGLYEVTVTDAAGCTLTSQTSLTEPISIVFEANFEDPNCEGFDTGSASVSNVSGGTGPYLIKISGGSFDTLQTFTVLTGGSYALTVQDANGCTVSQNFTLQVPGIPIIEAGDDVTIKLGESTSLHVVSNLFPENIGWSQQPGLSCYDCLQPSANPFETTTYTVAIISADDCTASDSVTVNVLKIRDLYAPNAFSPNGDGINDSFTLFGGEAAVQILHLRVFSRWGELVFDGQNLLPNDPGAGWDGTFLGKEMQPGAFAWFAEVEFLDGEVVFVEGDVTVVR